MQQWIMSMYKSSTAMLCFYPFFHCPPFLFSPFLFFFWSFSITKWKLSYIHTFFPFFLMFCFSSFSLFSSLSLFFFFFGFPFDQVIWERWGIVLFLTRWHMSNGYSSLYFLWSHSCFLVWVNDAVSLSREQLWVTLDLWSHQCYLDFPSISRFSY